MGSEFIVGSYRIEADRQRLRLRRRFEGTREVAVEGDIALQLVRQGGATETFAFSGIRMVDDREVEVEATSGAKLSATLVLSLRTDLDGLAVRVVLHNKGNDFQGRVVARLFLPAESDPHWLVPGVFYGENRPRNAEILFPGYSEIHRDASRLLSNYWTFRSDRASLPSVFCSTENLTAFIAGDEMDGTNEAHPAGAALTGVGFSGVDGLDGGDGALEINFSVPYTERPGKFSRCAEDGFEPAEAFVRIERNRPFNFHFECGLVAEGRAARERLFRALYEDRWSRTRQAARLSSHEASNLAMQGVARWHLAADQQMLRATASYPARAGLAPKRDARLEVPMLVGGRNGAFPAYVLLWHGRDATEMAPVQMGHMILDRICAELAPCGTIWPAIAPDGSGIGLPQYGTDTPTATARVVGEATLFVIRALRLELMSKTPHPRWSEAVASTLDYVISMQRTDGALPSTWRLKNGIPGDFNGISGAAFIAPLAAWGRFTGQRSYIDHAESAARYYAPMFQADDLIHGLGTDSGQAPACEDGHLALMGYQLLYEITRDEKYLDLAVRLANWALTFRMVTNIDLGRLTMLGASGFQTFGGDIESVASPLLGPWGLISYGEMVKLTALTDDPYYEKRANEGRWFASQLLARVDGEFNARAGQTLGVVSCTDGLLPKAMVESRSLVWTASLIRYAELVASNLVVSKEALEGDRRSIAEMASRESVMLSRTEIELPESASARRSRDMGVRKLQDEKTPLVDEITAIARQAVAIADSGNTRALPPTPDAQPTVVGGSSPEVAPPPVQRRLPPKSDRPITEGLGLRPPEPKTRPLDPFSGTSDTGRGRQQTPLPETARTSSAGVPVHRGLRLPTPLPEDMKPEEHTPVDKELPLSASSFIDAALAIASSDENEVVVMPTRRSGATPLPPRGTEGVPPPRRGGDDLLAGLMDDAPRRSGVQRLDAMGGGPAPLPPRPKPKTPTPEPIESTPATPSRDIKDTPANDANTGEKSEIRWKIF